MKIYTYDNKIMTVGGKWMEHKAQPGPGPEPSLPPYTLRLRFTEGYTPTFSNGTGVQVSQSPNIWDLTYENSDWSLLLYDNAHESLANNYSLLEVIGGNTTGVTNMTGIFFESHSLTSVPLFDTSNVTNMYGMFSGCNSLTSVPLFDTSNVTNMTNMFNMCSNLTTVPLLDTSNVTNMSNMFYQCYNVQTGALALYQQASNQTTPPIYHSATFRSCGRDTATGATELAQIPSDWK